VYLMMQEGIERELSGKLHVISYVPLGKKEWKLFPSLNLVILCVRASHLTQHTCLLLKFLRFSDILKFGEAHHLLAIQLIL
jgi:hypothetical protein